jgi:hypothetical protein
MNTKAAVPIGVFELSRTLPVRKDRAATDHEVVVQALWR